MLADSASSLPGLCGAACRRAVAGQGKKLLATFPQSPAHTGLAMPIAFLKCGQQFHLRSYLEYSKCIYDTIYRYIQYLLLEDLVS